MYIDKKRARWPYVAGILAALIIVIAILAARRASAPALAQTSADAVQQAIARSALQCYVVEGVYPPSLDYLEQRYGLRINTADYYVTYDSFASNLPPDVRVIEKSK